MAKKHTEEKHEAKKDSPPLAKKVHTTEKTPTTKKPRTRKAPPTKTSLPPLTKEEADAYSQFSEACKEVYEKFSKEKIDDRMAQLKSSPALTAVLRFMVMMHDLLSIFGVMKFNKNVAPALYKHLDEVQEQTGQKLPLARVLLDGIKMTKMELLSGVTVHPLPVFEEPEYKSMAARTPDPFDLDDPDNPEDEDFETQENPGEKHEQQPKAPTQTSSQAPSQTSPHVGPGGPYMDESVRPQSGTPIDQPKTVTPSTEEEPE